MRWLLVGLLAALPMAGMGEAAFAVAEIREAVNAFRGYCWQAFPEPITDEALWQKRLYRSPCGVVTLLPGETLWVPLPSACVHGEDAHDAGPFQAVWAHIFLMRLVDGKGGLHEACLYHSYYGGASFSGTGENTRAYLVFFDALSGKEHVFKLLSTYYPDNDNMPYPLSFYWDGEEVHVVFSELGFDEDFKSDPFPIKRCVRPRYCYRLRPFASRPAKGPLWEFFAEDTLRKESRGGRIGCQSLAPAPQTIAFTIVNMRMPMSRYRLRALSICRRATRALPQSPMTQTNPRKAKRMPFASFATPVLPWLTF